MIPILVLYFLLFIFTQDKVENNSCEALNLLRLPLKFQNLSSHYQGYPLCQLKLVS